MIPYASFLYFGVLLYGTVPTLISRLTGRLWRTWILLATAGMLMVQYWSLQSGWGSVVVREVWLVLGYALLQWLIALAYLTIRSHSSRQWIYYTVLVLVLLPLVATRVVPLLSPSYQLGFLGISYLTFRSLDVVFSIHDKLITALPPAQYLAYLLFFPTISSGPVDRYRRFAQDWLRQPTRADFIQDLDGAIHRFFTGFLYKFILSVLIKRYWLDPVASGTTLLHTVSYMYAYSLYLFFDFAGYSALAIATSNLLGIHPPENFDRPFLARNIRDFWNRWHISLSWWFRDHVYSRFVFAAIKGRWFKSKYTASYVGFFISMGLMGLWHGTAWHYVAYGLYHAALLVAFDLFERWNKQHKAFREGRPWQVASTLLTFNLVCFGFLIFSGRLG